MRLYLSSFDLGSPTSDLVALAPQGRVGLIMNALDNFPDQRAMWRARQSRQLEALGFSLSDLDLRDYFCAKEQLRNRLSDIDLVWINGGNTFILRRAMKVSGFDELVKEMLLKDEIAYAGFNAGTVIVAPSLRGLETVDDPDDVPERYLRETVWEGLDLLPFSIVVHYQSDHSESALVENEVAFYEREGILYRTLRDGQALVVRGSIDQLRVVG